VRFLIAAALWIAATIVSDHAGHQWREDYVKKNGRVINAVR